MTFSKRVSRTTALWPVARPLRLPARCPFCNCRRLSACGHRGVAGELLRVVGCRGCGKRFPHRARAMVGRHYPDRHVLEAVMRYCEGWTLQQSADVLNDRYGYRLSRGAVSRWVARYGGRLGYLRVRDTGRAWHPSNLYTSYRFNHRQSYNFACHNKKLELAEMGLLDHRLPPQVPVARLADYLRTIGERVRGVSFDGPRVARASQLHNRCVDAGVPVMVQQTAAVEAAALVIPTVTESAERHPRLQAFMLAADDATVAVEVPLWLEADELDAVRGRYGVDLLAGAPFGRRGEPAVDAPPSSLGRQESPQFGGTALSVTGHADVLQIRGGMVHILDYKPGARAEKPFAQLTAYALALTVRVPGLSLMDIRCTWFDEIQAYTFSPRDMVRRGAPSPAPSHARGR